MSDFPAKSFKTFLYRNKIKYSTVKSASGIVVIVKSSMPKTAFHFDEQNNYVKVQRIADSGYVTKTGDYHRRNLEYSFFAPNIYRLLAKLIQYELLTAQFVATLKF